MFSKTALLSLLLSLVASTTTTAITIPVPRADTITPPNPCPPNQIHHLGKSTCIDAIPCVASSNYSCPAKNLVCIDDPRDDCDPLTGKQGKECNGVCVEPHPTKKTCGGLLGLMCPEGWRCVDDLGDGCVPGEEGAVLVCGGVCV